MASKALQSTVSQALSKCGAGSKAARVVKSCVGRSIKIGKMSKKQAADARGLVDAAVGASPRKARAKKGPTAKTCARALATVDACTTPTALAGYRRRRRRR